METSVVRSGLFLAAGALLLTNVAAHAIPKDQPSYPTPFPPQNAQQATEFCLDYAYPLPEFSDSIGGAGGLAAGGINQIHPNPRGNGNNVVSRRFTEPVINAVVRPNTDTAYTGFIFDLAAEDVSLTVPPMESDRVYVFALYDPYGDNFENIGSINGDSPGKYLIRPAMMSGNYGKTQENCDSDYVACINSPTLHGRSTIRIEKQNHTSQDQDYINQYAAAIKVTGVNAHDPTADPLSGKDFENLSSDRTTQALQLLARLGSRNPPQDVSMGQQMPSIQKMAGISNGVYQQPSSVDLDQARGDLAQDMSDFVADPLQNTPLNNGWYVVSPSLSGSFTDGTNLIARSYIAKVLYLELTADQSIYVAPAQDVGQTFSVNEGEAYLLTFSKRPPMKTPGFWSLTMYNAAGYLAANQQGIFSLGDRSQLTYPDGEAVYGPNQSSRNDPFQILIQSTANAPPANWTHNWLPSPSGGKAFTLAFRLYGGKDSSMDGDYQYPTMVKQAAL